MELPDQFNKFNYIIDVIRKFIFADYLRTKEECLRFYLRNIINYSPYKCTYGLGGNFQPFLGYNYDNYSVNNIFYHVKTCSTRENGITNILNEEDVRKLLNTVEEKDIKVILENTINPPHEDIELLIEKEYGKKIFPIGKGELLELSSAKFVFHFSSIFNMINFVRHINNNVDISTDVMSIINQINDCQFTIAKDLFVMYCGIDTLVKNCEHEVVSTITTPFAFNDKAGQFIKDSISKAGIENFNKLTENDIEEVKCLISFLQITLSNKSIAVIKKIIKPF